MVRLIGGALSLSMVLVLLAGCQSLPNPWRDLPPPPTPLVSAVPIWEHLVGRRQALESLKGLARASLQVSTRAVTLDDVVIVQHRFDAIRLEGLGPVAQLLFLLIADTQDLSLYTPQEGRVLTGTASAENLMRLLGIALTPTALQYVLAGDIPLSALPTQGTLVYKRHDNLYFWQGQVPGQPLGYRIWFEPYDWHPVRFEMDDLGGQVILQVQYADFQRFQGFMLPYRITLEQPKAQRRVVWEYKEVQLNTGVMPALFRMRVPVGTARVAIEELPEPEADRLPRIW